jgi:uncharacterized membrane protein
MVPEVAVADSARWMHDTVNTLGSTRALDQLATALGRASDALGDLRPALQGDWLGHPLHPAMTDLPIGFWTTAMTLDLIGGRRARPIATRMVGLGLLSAPAAFLTGLAEFGTLDDQPTRRVAAAHWAGNAAATATFLLSWRARRHGHPRLGAFLGLVGGTVATGAGVLGGELAFPHASEEGVSHGENVEAEPQSTGEAPGGNGSPGVRAPGPMNDGTVGESGDVVA